MRNKVSIKREDAVAHIMTLMAEGEWQTGKTNEALAKEWDVAINTLNSWASIAGMNMRLKQMGGISDEHLSQWILATLMGVVEEAQATGDMNVIIKAIHEIAATRGLLRRTVQVEVTNPMENVQRSLEDLKDRYALTPEDLEYMKLHGELPPRLRVPPALPGKK